MIALRPEDISIKIIARRSAEGHPFSEIRYSFAVDGEPRCALTRVPYAIADTPISRGNETAAFIRRQARAGGVQWVGP